MRRFLPSKRPTWRSARIGLSALLVLSCDVYKPSQLTSSQADDDSSSQGAAASADAFGGTAGFFGTSEGITKGGSCYESSDSSFGGTAGGDSTDAVATGGDSSSVSRTSSGSAGGISASGSAGGTSASGSAGGGASGASESGDSSCSIVTSGVPDVVDDLEDNDDAIKVCSGRTGTWYTYDSSGNGASGVSPEPGSVFSAASTYVVPNDDLPSSSYAAKLYIESTSSDCGMGFYLNERADYDLSGYSSLSFWYRTEDVVASTLLLQLVLGATASRSEGSGNCTAGCNDHYSTFLSTTNGEWYQANVPLTTDWFFQRGFGTAVDFDLTTVRKIQFNVVAGAACDVALWVDQIELIP